jgi:hypothetical protein
MPLRWKYQRRRETTNEILGLREEPLVAQVTVGATRKLEFRRLDLPTDTPLVDILVQLKGNDPAGGAEILEQMEGRYRGH